MRNLHLISMIFGLYLQGDNSSVSHLVHRPIITVEGICQLFLGSTGHNDNFTGLSEDNTIDA